MDTLLRVDMLRLEGRVSAEQRIDDQFMTTSSYTGNSARKQN